MKSKTISVLALVLGLFAAIGVAIALISSGEEEATVAVLRLEPGIAIPQGAVPQEDDIRSVDLPERFSDLVSVAIEDTPGNRAWVLRRPAAVDIESGAVLELTHFLDQPEDRIANRIAANRRAISVPVSSVTAVGYFVEPGSTVDVIGTFQRLPGTFDLNALANLSPQTETRTILQSVRVLAVGEATTRAAYLDQGARYSTVTLEVSPADANTLAFAISEVTGGLSLVLRNPADEDLVDIPSIGWDNLSDGQ